MRVGADESQGGSRDTFVIKSELCLIASKCADAQWEYRPEAAPKFSRS